VSISHSPSRSVSINRAVVALLLAAVTCLAQQEPAPVFGTTVVVPDGLRGQIYFLRRNTNKLPNFRRKKPAGTIYATSLNIPTQDFRNGFPGVTDRFEWFAIDYRGRFWIEHAGPYMFFLKSDDGSNLYIDDRLLVNNDGIHTAREKSAAIELSGGTHTIRVSYFQGPRWQVALVLRVARPGEDPRIFRIDDFKPPPSPVDLRDPGAKQ
jgi:hypothetical protein